MASIRAYFRSVDTLNLAPPKATNRFTTSGFRPVPPWTIRGAMIRWPLTIFWIFSNRSKSILGFSVM